ncbi:MAG: hypothetical protein ACOCRX_00595 [Candidatus Woesearchaeota archaeon]
MYLITEDDKKRLLSFMKERIDDFNSLDELVFLNFLTNIKKVKIDSPSEKNLEIKGVQFQVEENSIKIFLDIKE